MLNADNGRGYYKIRDLFDEIESEIENGNNRAIQFEHELDRVYSRCRVALKMPD